MGVHPFTVHCAVCSESVDLTVDLSADENGKAVHENCYSRLITGSGLVTQWRDWQMRRTS
jgi:hypothetical protein